MGTIRIAMCQTVCLDGDRRGNLARLENAVAAAAAAGADLACLPETAIYGWVNPDAHHRAHPIPGEDSRCLCEVARRHNIFLCAGLAEKDEEHLYDSALFIDDKGEILLKHRKIILLSDLMTPPYTPGDAVTVVETKFGKIGVLICADTHERDILERMASLTPNLVIVPYGYAAPAEAWPQHGKELERVVRKAATVVHAPAIGTNLIGEITHGPWTGRTYAGHSVAADPRGRILAVSRDFVDDIAIVEAPVRK